MGKTVITFGLTETDNNELRCNLPPDDCELVCTDQASDLIALNTTEIVLNAEKMNADERATVIDFYNAVHDAAESVNWIGEPQPPDALGKRFHCYRSFEEYILLKRWQKKYKFSAFIRDGIVNPQYYAKPHILFVLRDMNWSDPYDLCLDLRKRGSGWKTWNNVSRWIKALLDGNEEYPRKINAAQRIEQTGRVSVLNLKKEGGGSRAKGEELVAAVREQHEEIYEEITLCEPDLIVCCGISSSNIKGNAWLLKDYVFAKSSDWATFIGEGTQKEWWFYNAEISGKEISVISFCHPQVTVLDGKRGHDNLFEPLYRDMLQIGELFLGKKD